MQLDIFFIDEALSHAILLMTFFVSCIIPRNYYAKDLALNSSRGHSWEQIRIHVNFPTNICIKEVRCMDVSEGLLVVECSCEVHSSFYLKASRDCTQKKELMRNVIHIKFC